MNPDNIKHWLELYDLETYLFKNGKRSVGGKRRMSILNMGDNQNIENVAYYSI